MSRFHVKRSVQINAPCEKVFQTVADYRTWTTWSPWLCAEPDAEVNLTEDSSSVGSVYSWKGEIVGQGEIEHRQLQPGRLIEDEIRFVKPFRSRSQVAFEFEATGEAVKITWHMHGSLPWFLFWMRSQMEGLIGMDYERGLRMLKEWIETGQILSKTSIRGVESIGPLRMAGVRKTCSFNAVGPSMEAAMAEGAHRLSEHGLATAEAISVYHRFDLRAKTFDYTSGYAIPDSTDLMPDGLSDCSIPETHALCVEHIGSYDNLGNAWSVANQFIRYKKLKQSNVAPFEIYRNDPSEVAPADLRTDIYLPLK